jgi:hypothetical protein
MPEMVACADPAASSIAAITPIQIVIFLAFMILFLLSLPAWPGSGVRRNSSCRAGNARARQNKYITPIQPATHSMLDDARNFPFACTVVRFPLTQKAILL